LARPRSEPYLGAMTTGPYPTAGLAEIPLHDLGEGGAPALLEAERERALALLAGGRAQVPGFAVALADRLSRRWLEAGGNPYLDEIRAVAACLPVAGAYYLNVSHEWGCTTAVTADGGASGGPRLLRALDWPLDGLGRHLVAARFAAPAGDWINLGWPGFVGCIQGLAPGRFAASFNQAPLTRVSGLFALDWAVARARVWRRAALPAAHLLRRVFETAPDYAAARRQLAGTPIALPAIFTLAGAAPGEGCVIERLEDRACVHQAPAAAANHWCDPRFGSGRPRGDASRERRERMADQAARLPRGGGHDFAWLAPPILNPTTRLAMAAEPGSGRLSVLGIEAERPVCRLAVTAPPQSARQEPPKALTAPPPAL